MPSSALARKWISRMSPHSSAIQLWASNNCAAKLPATEGLPSRANSIGTTRKPMVVRLPHQRAASISATRSFIATPFRGS